MTRRKAFLIAAVAALAAAFVPTFVALRMMADNNNNGELYDPVTGQWDVSYALSVSAALYGLSFILIFGLALVLALLLGGKRRALRDEVAALIHVLSEPPSDAEMREGWDADLKAKWREWFTRLDEQLARGEAPEGYVGTARAMDFDGVGRTKLSNLAARVDNRLNRGERYN